MINRRVFIATVALSLVLGAGQSLGLSAGALQQGIPSLAPMLEQVIPAVVSIRITRTVDGPNRFYFENGEIPEELQRFFEFNLPDQVPAPGNRMVGAGSGVIIDADEGFVVTNHHVINNADEIAVTLSDGRTLAAQLLGSDPGTDVALLRIEADNLTALSFADSEALRIGDFVVAIGNPYGLGQTVTAGIVSALGRAGLNNENYEDFIQTDAAINVGNSGGALVDMEGRLVGINTAIISGNGGGSDGIGFAVPSNMVESVTAHLERDGEVRRGLLGVQISDLTPQLASTLKMDMQTGALVTNVLPDGAAEAAGIQVYDLITAVNDQTVRSGRELRNVIGLQGVDQQVRLSLVRNGRELSLTAVLRGNDGESVASRVGNSRAPDRPEFNGARLADNSAGDGVMVSAVDPQSRAAAAGLRAGDVIVEINREAVSDLAAFNSKIAAGDGLIALTVIRDQRRMLLLMQ